MYTYSGAAPQNPESRSDPVRRAAVVLELRAGADDEVGHARRLHARVHGRLVARLSRLRGLQPQRHDADVRDAGRQRRRPAAAGRRAGRGGPAASRGGGAGGAEPTPAPTRPDAASGAARGAAAAAGGSADGTRRIAAARVVSRHPDSAGRAEQLVAPQQRQLHGDRRPLGPPADGLVPQRGRRELLSQDPELDRRRQDRAAVRLRPAGAARHDAGGRDGRTCCAIQRIEVGQATGEIKVSDGDLSRPGRT